jgi:hypothetical protein
MLESAKAAQAAAIWYRCGMSGTLQIERNAKTGRFQPGNNGGPGRKPGSRNALGQAFLEDLRDAWERHGAMALARCAVDEPAQFVRVVAGLLPRDVNLNVAIDATEFAAKFKQAVAMLGNDPDVLPAPKRMKVINHGG